jgi:hypothetical protein
MPNRASLALARALRLGRFGPPPPPFATLPVTNGAAGVLVHEFPALGGGARHGAPSGDPAIREKAASFLRFFLSRSPTKPTATTPAP